MRKNTRIPAIDPGPPRVRAKLIAEKYDVTERTVLLWAEKGIIPSIRIEGTVRFDLKAVIASIEGTAQPAST